MNKKLALLAFATTLCLSGTYAQSGIDFWFAAPEITDIITSYNGLPADRPIKLHFAAKSQNATVQISQPALNSTMPMQTVNVPANGMASIDLTPWIDGIETRPGNSVLNTGLRITSSVPITAYYTNECVPNAESFMLKGSHALGIDFWIPAQNIGSNDDGIQHTYSSFDIIATQDNTNITITPSHNIVGHNAGAPFSITLNKGETWSAEASSKQPSQHLGGSHVTAKNPIAITTKDDWMICPDIGLAYELIGDQILPTNKLGNKYITVKGDLSGQSDRVFVMATEDNTIINQNGVQIATINKGETSALSFNTEIVMYIETNKPSSVYHLSGVEAETGAKQLIPITEKGCDTVLYRRLMNNKFNLTFVVKNSGIGSFKLNGSSNVITSSQFSPVPSNPNYSYAKIDLSNSIYTQGTLLKIENTKVGFQMGALDGSVGWGADYVYFNEFTGTSTETGIEEIGSSQNPVLYPNPTVDQLTIGENNISAIKVFNLLGQEQIVPIKYGKDKTIIGTENLASGNYIIKLSNKKGKISTLKFTKVTE